MQQNETTCNSTAFLVFKMNSDEIYAKNVRITMKGIKFDEKGQFNKLKAPRSL